MKKREIVFYVFTIAVAILSISSCCHQSQTPDPNADTPKEASMRAAGLVDIHDYDTTIVVDLIYAKPLNFMGRTLYHDVNKAFMLPELAEKLANAQKILKKKRLDLNLIVYDAARPISIQKEMWASVEGTDMEDFVANPGRGAGMHNLGSAVDVTLIDCTGHPIPMGSEYDYFGRESRTNIEEQLLKEGRITIREYENRRLLREVMVEAGLRPIAEEWWHFDLLPAKEARATLKVIE